MANYLALAKNLKLRVENSTYPPKHSLNSKTEFPIEKLKTASIIFILAFASALLYSTYFLT